eukprot:gnl/TRDRNA2_/TRDRNA2_143874_c0_seq1.p1 gnl/TRDRNA2_/TRDRNA2_143874_c0~~gnl/TRDRNA2_/TRDRNA2_143874_c0_seq1.p1  ORF type:complete len:123 (+),score=11.12 gnl/TRDRNA2_/TRDRNA2_143874_c0_seq1:122-490(+)
MVMWALSRHESPKGAWALMDHAKYVGVSFSQRSTGALIMECEQKMLIVHEIKLLKGMAHAAGVQGVEMYFDRATNYVAALRLEAQTKLLRAQSDLCTKYEASKAEPICIWCRCRGQWCTSST